MASTSKAFKIVCGKIGTHRDDTHNLCIFCLGNEHARDVLEGKSACTMSFFYVKAPLSSCPSFRGKRGSCLLPAIRNPPLPRHGGNEISSWMWPMSEKEKRDRPFSCASAENESELLDCDDAIFISINQIQRLVLFSAYERVFWGLWIIKKKKKKLFFLVFIGFSILVMKMCENGYEGMSPVQEMINSLSLCGRHPLSRLGHLSP